MTRLKKRKDNLYCKQVPIGKDADGKRLYRSVYAHTIAELERKVDEFKASMPYGLRGDEPTFDEVADEWRRLLSVSNPNTVKVYEGARKRLRGAPFAGKKMPEVTHADLQGYVNSLLDEGLTRTVEIVAMCIRQICEHAVGENAIPSSPARRLKIARDVSAPPKRELEAWERDALDRAPLDARERAFVSLCLYAGLRRGEALALSAEDVDFSAGVVRVRKSLMLASNPPEVKPSPKSDAGFRRVPIAAALRAALAPALSNDALGCPNTAEGVV
jgi:integrase